MKVILASLTWREKLFTLADDGGQRRHYWMRHGG